MATHLDVELVFNRDIAADDTLPDLDGLLTTLLPTWSADLRIRLSRRDEVARQGPFRDWVVHHATSRGETYRQTVAAHGAGDERRSGKVEIRGAGEEVVVVVGIDSDPLRLTAGRALLGNRISLQVRRAKVERRAAAAWALDAFGSLCEALDPYWGSVRTGEEYDAKVMSSGQTVQAVGRDFSRSLPGLFTANHFGPAYVDLLGRDRLLAVPGATAVGDGVRLVLGDDPTAWDSRERRAAEKAALEHLGEDHFFDLGDPDRDAVAPAWP